MKRLSLLTTITFCVFLFSKCCEPAPPTKSCCEGYTGPITNHLADSLRNKDHFIIKDSIIAWTARYEANKNFFNQKGFPNANDAFGYSTSFNRCIIKAIICNDSCIGLRVVYGMSPDLKVHVMMVGIKPDYNSLYIKRPEACLEKTKKETAKTTELNKGIKTTNMFQGDNKSLTSMSDIGGAEYGMEP